MEQQDPAVETLASAARGALTKHLMADVSLAG